jgi:hypothetical protein
MSALGQKRTAADAFCCCGGLSFRFAVAIADLLGLSGWCRLQNFRSGNTRRHGFAVLLLLDLERVLHIIRFVFAEPMQHPFRRATNSDEIPR